MLKGDITREIEDLKDEIKVINNRLEAMNKTYVNALSELKQKELSREVKNESSIPKEEIGDKRKHLLPIKGSINIRHRNSKEKPKRNNKS